MDKRKGVGEFGGLEFLHVRAKKIINEVRGQSTVPFRFTINAYRGCSHACTYCFARPTHEYLNLDIGKDFDTKIVVKVNAVERVRAELKNKSWNGDLIAMGTNTDPYQRAEGKYQLTRGIIKELSKAKNPFSILTKSSLITRDIDVLTEAAERTRVQANFSIATLDSDVWQKTEPGTPHPSQRVKALKKLTDAGIECGVLMAPIFPGISDKPEQLAQVVDACVNAGASWIGASMLHLRSGVKQHWFEWMQQEYPEMISEYQKRYGNRAYASKEQSHLLSRRVSQMIASEEAKRAQ